MVSKIVKEQFKRKFVKVTQSDWYHTCISCRKSIKPKQIFTLDTRNDKYCMECANDFLHHMIKKLQSFQKEMESKSILQELEKENDILRKNT